MILNIRATINDEDLLQKIINILANPYYIKRISTFNYNEEMNQLLISTEKNIVLSTIQNEISNKANKNNLSGKCHITVVKTERFEYENCGYDEPCYELQKQKIKEE